MLFAGLVNSTRGRELAVGGFDIVEASEPLKKVPIRSSWPGGVTRPKPSHPGRGQFDLSADRNRLIGGKVKPIFRSRISRPRPDRVGRGEFEMGDHCPVSLECGRAFSPPKRGPDKVYV